MIRQWTDTNYFMNWKTCVLESITDIQYPCSECMYSRYRNVDTEWIIMCYWNIILIKLNALDLITTIFEVTCKKITCIRTVTFLNTCTNLRMEDLCSAREEFDWHGIQNMVKQFSLSYCTNRAYFQNWRWGTLRYSPIFLGVRVLSKRRNSGWETTGLIWSNMDQSY